VHDRANLSQVKESPSDSLVTAVIPTYNAARYVVEAVESALNQQDADIEVIVVDDGSTDDTESRLAPFLDRIRYIRQNNSGPSVARNRGIREAKGKFIAFLDADDCWLPPKTAMQIALFAQKPHVGLVHSNIYVKDQRSGEQYIGKASRLPYSGYCYPQIFWGHCVAPSASMIRKSVFDTVGLFDESIRGPSFEDEDLWLRIARVYEFDFVKEPLIVYRKHECNGSLNQVRNVEDEFRVLVKALNEDPTLWLKLDRTLARQKLYRLAFSAGYSCVHANDIKRSREYFMAAWKYAPINPLPIAYWGFSFLPNRVRELIRSLRRITSAQAQSES
jgi:glycosyltransferase involved in cell wall biosynthesis